MGLLRDSFTMSQNENQTFEDVLGYYFARTFCLGSFPLFGTDVPLSSQMVWSTSLNSSTGFKMENYDSSGLVYDWVDKNKLILTEI